jgi:hypothetical protein
MIYINVFRENEKNIKKLEINKLKLEKNENCLYNE